MIVAREKRNQNIAEYLLYMWQIEDIIRACNLDIDIIYNNIIAATNVDDATKNEIREWYEGLIIMMRNENKKVSGHLQINNNVLIRLNDLHLQLLNSTKFPQYGAEYFKTLPFIVELRATMPEGQKTDELETCFNALYGIMMLHLQGKKESEATSKAIQQISHFIGTLAAYYKLNEEKPILDNE